MTGNNPRALLVSQPTPFIIIHDFNRVWKVIPIRKRDHKTVREITNLDRRCLLPFDGRVSRRALTPEKDELGRDVIVLSGIGLYQLINSWMSAYKKTEFDASSDLPKILDRDYGGLQCAEQWMTGTFVFLARDHSKLLKGDIPRDVIDDFDRYQAENEWHVNADFWREVFAA